MAKKLFPASAGWLPDVPLAPLVGTEVMNALLVSVMSNQEGPQIVVNGVTIDVEGPIAEARDLLRIEVQAMQNTKSHTGKIPLRVDREEGSFTRTHGSFLEDGFAFHNSVEISGFRHKGNNIKRAMVAHVWDTVLQIAWPEEADLQDEEGKAQIQAIGSLMEIPPEIPVVPVTPPGAPAVEDE